MSLLWTTAAGLAWPEDDGPHELRPDGFYPIDAEQYRHGRVAIEHIQPGDLVRPWGRQGMHFEQAFKVIHDPSHPSDTSQDPDEQFPTRMFIVEHHRRFSPHEPEGTAFEVYRPRPQQVQAARYQVSDSPSGHPAWVEPKFPVSDLIQYADPGHREMSGQHIETMTQSLRERGFQPRRHHGFDYWGTRGSSEPAGPIHLVYQNNGHHFLINGNHRAWAAQDAGLEHVPVLITDMRMKRSEMS